MEIKRILRSLSAFEKDAHTILGAHEAAPSRVVLLSDSYKKLSALSLSQDELLRQSLRCVEEELYRAAHVMAWAGCMDFLEEKLASDGLVKLRALRPKWKTATVDELREETNEYQIIDAARELALLGKAEGKAFHGMLSKRNECAHPSSYFPGLNETLGYISEVLNRIAQLQPRRL